jgi:hypothetical protein
MLQQTGLTKSPALTSPGTGAMVSRETLRITDYRRLFNNLGAGRRAPGRMAMTPQALADAMGGDGAQSFVLRQNGNLAGLCDISRGGWEEYELVTYGVLRSLDASNALFYLVDQTVRALWAIGKPRRVWLRITDADPAGFLENFEKIGFGIIDRKDEDWPDEEV